MKKLFGYFLSVMLIASTFYFGTIDVNAAGEKYGLSLVAYNCYEYNVDEEACTGPNGDYPEELDLDEISNNGNVQPGKAIMVSLMYRYTPGSSTTENYSMQIGVNYNSDVIEPIDVVNDLGMPTTYYDGIWPAQGTTTAKKKKTNWSIDYNIYNNSQIRFLIGDSQLSDPLVTSGEMLRMYFVAKEDAPSGSVANLSIDYGNGVDQGYTKISDEKAKKTANDIEVSGLQLNVQGEMSNVKTLNELNVTKGTTTYPLDPTFVPDDTTTKAWSTTVPNQIDNIDISVTPTDPNSTIISGTGNQELNIGENSFDIIIQAENGETETYQVNIYRLNNESTLKSLSLTDVNIGAFSSSTTSYSAVVPYTTSSTTVSANVTDNSNATIESGTGLWNLENTGTTINTRNIVVKAENCDSKYSTVVGNTCSETTYKIEVTRTAASSDATLSDLVVDGTTVSGFNPTTYEYDIGTVDNDKTSINVGAVVNDTGKAKLKTPNGSKSLEVGDNTIVVTVEAEDGSTQDYTINVRRLSADSTLKSLTVTSDPIGTFSPTFSSTVYDYYTYVAPSTVETVNIAAAVNDTENATIVSGTGEFNIDENPTVNVIVQAEDGSTSTYIVKLIRNKSANNNLKSLSIDGYSLNETFSPSTTTYTANVSGDVESIDVSAEVEDTGKATIVSGTGTHNLNVGTNTIQVRVKAENGDTKDYTITVERAKKTISALTDLKVDGSTVPDFDESTLEYTLTKVPFSKTSIEVEATPKDPDSTVTGTGTIPLQTGDNKKYVVITAQDGVTQTSYILNIEREKDSNNYLSDLTIDGTTITGFNKTITHYTYEAENSATSLNLVATPESENATIIISGNSNFVTTSLNKVEISVTAENGDTKVYEIDVTRKKSDNNYLSDISVSKGTLEPTFDKEILEYTVNVDRSVTSVTLTPTVEDETATTSISGPTSLEVGDNNYVITVTSESNLERKYKVNVKRNPSNNNYLSNLAIDGTQIDGFNKETLNYRVEVDGTVSSVAIAASTEEIHATVSGEGTFDLVTGDNTFDVVVTAEDTTTRTYTIVINKAKSNNSALSNLSVVQASISPAFSPSTLEYSAEVDYSVTNADIVAVAADPAATIEGDGNKALNTGLNSFDIIVTSEDNTTTTYKLNITRAKNNNALLNNLTVSGGYNIVPEFDPDTTTYSTHVPNSVESVEVNAFTQDPAATIEGDGTINLVSGENTVNIEVTAEDGVTKKIYTLNIDRERSSDNLLKSLSVSAGTLTPTFDKDTNDYEVTVPNEVENLTITTETNHPLASVSIAGNNNLTVGNNASTVTVTAENGDINVYNITIVRQPSSNNFLSSLSVVDINSNEYINDFAKTKLEYNITVENDIESVTISGEVEDNTSTPAGFGDKNLDVGLNEYSISVTSAAGIVREYKVNITRKSNSNTYLSTLEVKNADTEYTLNPAFDKNTESYTVDVPYTVTSVNVSATAEEDTSSVNGTGDYDLVTGPNQINIDVTAEDLSVKTYIITVNKAASTDNNLANLVITPGVLEPSFSSDVLTYTSHVDNLTTTMNITATPNDPTATVTGDGIKSLSVGTQLFEIEVKAENGDIKKYQITVERDASSNKDLQDLTVDGSTISGFNKDVLEYTVNVDNEKTTIDIEAVAADETAVVAGTGIKNLNTGDNKFEITVTAEDGTVKTYKVNVNREKSSNNYLKTLNVSEGVINPEFSKEVDTYSLSVPYEVTTLSITATPEDETATINIDGNSDFEVGNNQVSIDVMAEDGTTRSYKLNVTRQPLANNYLLGISVRGSEDVVYALSPVFNRETYEYEVTIPGNENLVTISVEKEDESLIVTGDGTIPITTFPQSQIITVSTDAGLSRTYTLNFVKGKSSNANLLSLSVDKGTLDPVFSPTEYNYSVDLPIGTTSITVNATKSESEQIVTGDGEHSLTSGTNTIQVIVTSENGNANTYTILANVPEADNVLDSLTVSDGELSPAFDKDVNDYVVDLETPIESITIEATSAYPVDGTGTFNLNPGTNEFEITTTKDGIVNTYKLTVNNGTITSNYLTSLEVEGYNLDETFDKTVNNYNLAISDDTVTSVNVNAVPENPGATVVVAGNDSLVPGNNVITVTVTDPTLGDNVYSINVMVGMTEIKSEIHTIDKDKNIIPTIYELKSSKEIKDEMLNPNEFLHIFDASGTEISDDDRVANGYVIKLIINGKEYDSKTLIIKGDVNCNGEIEVADIVLLERFTLESLEDGLTINQTYAGDVNDDTGLDVADIVLLERHILQNYNIFTKTEVE